MYLLTEFGKETYTQMNWTETHRGITGYSFGLCLCNNKFRLTWPYLLLKPITAITN